MPKISSVFKSRFVKAFELSYETRLPAKIDSIFEETFGSDLVPKVVLKVSDGNGWVRDLVLNQNNGRRLASAFGDNTDDWPGAAVELWVEDIDFDDKIVASVKIGPAPPAALPNPPEPKPPLKKELDDDVPF
jgi:hypothetical protein